MNYNLILNEFPLENKNLNKLVKDSYNKKEEEITYFKDYNYPYIDKQIVMDYFIKNHKLYDYLLKINDDDKKYEIVEIPSSFIHFFDLYFFKKNKRIRFYF